MKKDSEFSFSSLVEETYFGWLTVTDVPFSEEPAEYGGAFQSSDIRKVEALVAEHLILGAPPLRGQEFLFLRKKADLSRTQLGKLLGVTDETVRAWENDKETRVSLPMEAALRLIAAEKLGIRLALSYSQLVAASDQPRPTTLRMPHPRHAG